MIYSSRDFIAWYLHHINNFKGVKIHVGRIDHGKNYSFDNIQMLTAKENIMERNHRLGNPLNSLMRKVSCFNSKTMEKICDFDSGAEAARFAKTQRCHVISMCKGKRTATKSGYTFRYLTNG